MSSIVVPLSAVIMVSCAGQVPPSGGPADTTPPTIVSTYPKPRTTHFNDSRVVLEFSEYVDRRSVEESIFISPDIGPLEFDWSGREVEIVFQQPLKEDITYVVTIGTDVIDVKNRNRMAESFSLPFATGSVIDSSSLGGRVFDAKPEGITIFAYALHTRLADTVNPATLKPDYVTQSGSNGTFRLEYIAHGRYRLYAVRDQYKNLLYDPQVDQIGMSTGDFDLMEGQEHLSGIQFQLTREDTTAPFVLDAEAVHRNLVTVRFSEMLAGSTIVTPAFSLHDTLTQNRIASHDVFYDPRATNSIHVRCDDLDSTRTYRVIVDGVRDTAGNLVNPRARMAVFQGVSLADTAKPVLTLAGLQDSVRNVAYNVVFDVIINEAIRRESFENGFRLLDSVGLQLKGNFFWYNSSAVRFIPEHPLNSLAWYAVHVRLDSVQDLVGNRYVDSVMVRRFQTIDWRKFGSIKGRVENPLGEGCAIFIFAISVTDKTAAPVMREIDGSGNFNFEYLLEGQYVLQTFCDRDGNGRYSPGKSYPFVRSERFAVYPDTIKVRARWPVEGVVVRLGEW